MKRTCFSLILLYSAIMLVTCIIMFESSSYLKSQVDTFFNTHSYNVDIIRLEKEADLIQSIYVVASNEKCNKKD